VQEEGRPVVDRCVCHGVHLQEVLKLHQEEPILTPAEVASRLGLGDRCSLCTPYIALTMETGMACHPPIRRRR
jgi:bacterioferritin-associated ferredoxin